MKCPNIPTPIYTGSGMEATEFISQPIHLEYEIWYEHENRDYISYRRNWLFGDYYESALLRSLPDNRDQLYLTF